MHTHTHVHALGLTRECRITCTKGRRGRRSWVPRGSWTTQVTSSSQRSLASHSERESVKATCLSPSSCVISSFLCCAPTSIKLVDDVFTFTHTPSPTVLVRCSSCCLATPHCPAAHTHSALLRVDGESSILDCCIGV